MNKTYLMLCYVLTLLLLTGCASSEHKTSNAVLSDDLLKSGTEDSSYVELINISDRVWVHTTYENYNGIRTPSNGMLIDTSKGLVLIDTPWNNAQTKELIKLAKEKFKKDITLAIITHAHDDRIGGIDTLLENKIDVKSTSMTMKQAEKNGFKKPSPDLDERSDIMYGDTDIEVFYPGEGHTSDNIVVWLPKYNILFGGCLIKSLESTDIGNTADANLNEWPNSVKNLREKYPNAKVVVPGHGKWGGSELIDHTLELLKK